ncbi:MAG TPA: winged helix-turn-helix domain-containing protein [Gaiellaceae bacterium]|nr:winged helix-turn-helix domain-containing protein [Gaiellaceae bacterium]
MARSQASASRSHASASAASRASGSARAKDVASPPRDDETNEQISLPQPDYEAVDVLVVREPEQLRALGDDLRAKIVVLLRERAASITELAEKLELPKGTVGHHVKVLEKARLIRVVRTRKVRAMTERYYGRTARLFLFKSSDDADGEGVRDVVAASLRTVADEMLPSADDDQTTFAVLRINLGDEDAVRFVRRLNRLMRDFRKADDPAGQPYGLAISLYRRASDA